DDEPCIRATVMIAAAAARCRAWWASGLRAGSQSRAQSGTSSAPLSRSKSITATERACVCSTGRALPVSLHALVELVAVGLTANRISVAAHIPKALNSTAEQRDLLRRNQPFRARMTVAIDLSLSAHAII